jgi:hypothetical protein
MAGPEHHSGIQALQIIGDGMGRNQGRNVMADSAGEPCTHTDDEAGRPTRRVFLRGAAALPPLIAALFAATVTISCDDSSSSSSSSSDDDDDGGSGGSACDTDLDYNTEISGNHGHTVTLTSGDVATGTPIQLMLTTGSGHTHMLDLTAQNLTDIDNGDEVTVESSSTGHTHDVTFNCVADANGGSRYFVRIGARRA